MKASEKCIELIKEFEGYASQPYADVGSKQTIGYGHLIRKGETFTRLSESEATTLLCKDLEAVEACIEDCIDVPITQGQFDSMCSLAFNIGCHAFTNSTLVRKFNAGDLVGCVTEFPKWSRVGLNQVAGLLRRRLAEQILFQS